MSSTDNHIISYPRETCSQMLYSRDTKLEVTQVSIQGDGSTRKILREHVAEINRNKQSTEHNITKRNRYKRMHRFQLVHGSETVGSEPHDTRATMSLSI